MSKNEDLASDTIQLMEKFQTVNGPKELVELVATLFENLADRYESMSEEEDDEPSMWAGEFAEAADRLNKTAESDTFETLQSGHEDNLL